MLSVRAAIGSVLGAIGVLLAALLTVTTLQLRIAGDRADAEARRAESFTLAEGLRQSSNDLTRMVRLYVSTGDARYRDHYQQILDIRDGVSPRPVDYDNAFWDRVVAGTESAVELGPPRSLLDLLRDARFAPAEFAALEAGKAASDRLATLELEVIAAVEGLVDPPLDATEAALVQPQLLRLEDAGYHAAKNRIMGSIQTMVKLADARTAGRLATLRGRAGLLLGLQLAIIGLMAVVSGGALFCARRRVVRPLASLTGVTRQIAAGDYGRRVEIRSLRELGELGDRFNEMGEAIRLDISRREVAEAAAVEAQRAAEAADEAKSYFLATMSHEIRTPLNAVLGMSEILRESPLDADQRDCIDTISTSGDHLLGVINDILDFSKIESGMVELDEEVFELRPCFEDAIDVAGPKASEKGLDLVLDVADGTPELVRADRARVRQILLNYLSNAVKFTEHGAVVVEVSSRPLGSPGEVGPERAEVRVGVRDSGIGIPADRLHRLFRSFSQVDASTTRRYGGTGLGLAICERLARLMGGAVSVESHPGSGSTFSFTFVADVEPAGASPALVDAGALQGRRVLVVDDNDASRRVLRSSAEAWGMHVVDTARAADALALVEAGETFDLAVVDFAMPDMDGGALAGAIRSARGDGHLPMVLLSSERRTTRSVADVDLVMTKPVRRSALLDAFVEVLSACPPTRGQRAAGRSTVTTDPYVGAVASSGPPLRILLAEDNVANQKVALRMLRALGHDADVVDNGSAAVDAVGRRRYDLVLMDVHMPEMDGLEATRLIRLLPADSQPRIFAMTASALDSERQECLEAGMERHLGKPISLAQLRDALADVGPPAIPTDGAPAGDGGDVDRADAAAPDEVDPAPDLLELDALAASISAEGVVELIDAIVDDAPEAVRTVRDALDSGDAAALRRKAHSMKSNTAMVGARRLSDLCARVEDLAKAERLEDASPLARQLLDAYDGFVEELTTARGRWS